MEYSQYIRPELLILVPVLYLLGVWMRQSKLMSNRLIPLMVGLLGVLLSMIYVLATGDLSSGQNIAMAVFTALTQGILVGGASVYANQLVKQAKGDPTDTDGQAIAMEPMKEDTNQVISDILPDQTKDSDTK